MRMRRDGSFQSANTPTYDNVGRPREDFTMYRCMISKVLFIDNPNNMTQDSQNPEVLYEAVVLGGYKTGSVISNIRVAPALGGGNSSYYERTLKPTSKVLNAVALAQHDGDIVYVQFSQGHQGYPLIIAMGKGLSDSISGTKVADGPRELKAYNGVVQEINNKGELIITRMGGSLDVTGPTFNPNTSGFDSKLTLGQNQSATLETAGTAKLALNKGTVALGANGIELLQKISDSLDKLITWADSVGSTHTHIGNLGYETAPPTQASGYTQLGSDLSTIKSAIDSIKGSL